MKSFALYSLLLLFSTIGCVGNPLKTIPYSKASFAIHGRYTESFGSVGFSCPGVSILFIVSDTKVLHIIAEDRATDKANSNWIDIAIGNAESVALELKPGKHTYKIELGEIVKKGSGTLIKITKRTESFVGEIHFYGVEVEQKATIPAMYVVDGTTIQFIGNSITCGYGNMVSIPVDGNPQTGFHSKNENARLAYAMQTASKLKAWTSLIAYSGKGMLCNYDGDTNETMPKIYDRIYLHKHNSPLVDYSKEHADIIVINLGANDYASEANHPSIDDSAFVKTYHQFVEKLRTLHPDAIIICAGGATMSDNWPEGKQALTRFKANVLRVCSEQQIKGNTKIYPFFFSFQGAPFGEDYHPTIASHTKMAEELTAFIKTLKR